MKIIFNNLVKKSKYIDIYISHLNYLYNSSKFKIDFKYRYI